LTRLIRRYDKDVNGSWSFREFLTFVQPLTQYSLKAKDLNTGLVLGGADPLKVGSGGDDKVQFAETSSTSSLGELNALLKKKHGRGGLKDNKRAGSAAGPALSKASKSTAAMSQGPFDGNFPKGQMSTIHGGAGGYQSSIGGRDDSSIYNMRNVDSAFGGGHGTKSRDVLNFPYMCDENPNAQDDMQFADKIKMMNNQKASSVPTT
jgi:hypothetical protein